MSIRNAENNHEQIVDKCWSLLQHYCSIVITETPTAISNAGSSTPQTSQQTREEALRWWWWNWGNRGNRVGPQIWMREGVRRVHWRIQSFDPELYILFDLNPSPNGLYESLAVSCPVHATSKYPEPQPDPNLCIEIPRLATEVVWNLQKNHWRVMFFRLSTKCRVSTRYERQVGGSLPIGAFRCESAAFWSPWISTEDVPTDLGLSENREHPIVPNGFADHHPVLKNG